MSLIFLASTGLYESLFSLIILNRRIVCYSNLIFQGFQGKIWQILVFICLKALIYA